MTDPDQSRSKKCGNVEMRPGDFCVGQTSNISLSTPQVRATNPRKKEMGLSKHPVPILKKRLNKLSRMPCNKLQALCNHKT
jgi:hypothetical protein